MDTTEEKLKKEIDELNKDDHASCPDCGHLLRAKELWEGGGEECTNPECNYWFCY